MVYDLNFLDTATHPSQPFTPQPLRDAGISLLLGAIAGAALAIVSDQIRIPLETYRQRMRLDSNTGVFNRRYFRQLVEEDAAKDDADGQLSIGIVELSGMKDLLESLPPSGLQYLFNNVTNILRKELRGNDIIGRWNDISFSIMLPTTPSTAAKRTFDRICQALSQQVFLGAYGVTVHLEPHIGGAVYCNPITAQDLFIKAEDALNKARASNGTGNPVFVWELNSPFWVQEESKSLSEIP
jgi:diguanylate cyclase (GGDEF)-like protein